MNDILPPDVANDLATMFMLWSLGCAAVGFVVGMLLAWSIYK